MDNFHLTSVLMDGGGILNRIYAEMLKDAVRLMAHRARQDQVQGYYPWHGARCTGKVTLYVVFVAPDNYRLEPFSSDIVPF